MASAEEIVDALEGVSGGPHPGFRAAHARGVFCRGTFTATPEARELSRAQHLQGEPVRTTVRFSNGSGDPGAPDTDRRDGRGMAAKFELPDGSETDIVAITIPVFFVRTAPDFLDFLHARKPDPETGEMDMEKVGAFVAAHPETQAALQLILPTFVPPASYATCAYNSLHAFGLTNAAGETRFVRYRWEPDAGEQALTDEESAASPPDYLAGELAERLSRSPAVFTLTAKLAEDDDPLDDPTVAWPETRTTVTLGRLELMQLDPDAESGGEIVVFDPTRVTDGVELSDDEILATRPLAYSVSVERRSGADTAARSR
ncbi:MAG TPA: catalase family peroxidase [Solirubrobacterales bacterium]|nr:catalase family peroxidase [Solirubrobacterales bacterium]